MNDGNRELACHHINLQSNCIWCDIYIKQAVRQCDRCKNTVNTDLVYLSLAGPNPELVCVYCHHDEEQWRPL